MFTIEADISKQIQKLNRFQRLAIPEAKKQTIYKFGFVHKNFKVGNIIFQSLSSCFYLD